MPPTIICVDATIDGKKVGGEKGVFQTIDDTDEMTCHQLLITFLKDKGLGYLPKGSIVVLRCVKMCDARLRGGRLAADIGLIEDCTVFLPFKVTLAMVEVPTKKFSFVCTRHVEARPLSTNINVFMFNNPLIKTPIFFPHF
jgi:hypothetical protein